MNDPSFNYIPFLEWDEPPLWNPPSNGFQLPKYKYVLSVDVYIILLI